MKLITLTHDTDGEPMLLRTDEIESAIKCGENNHTVITTTSYANRYVVRETPDEILAMVDAPPEPAMIHDDWDCPHKSNADKLREIEPLVWKLLNLMKAHGAWPHIFGPSGGRVELDWRSHKGSMSLSPVRDAYDKLEAALNGGQQ